jgi:hypothetical protein
MADDTKQLLLQLAETCEQLYFERTVYKDAVEIAGSERSKRICKHVISDPALREPARRKFQPVYERIADSDEVVRVLEGFLSAMRNRDSAS